MWKTVDVRILLLVLLLLTNVKTTVLSDWKKCGDPECETSIIRVRATKDYAGPDCLYLNFKSGEDIMVYFKLSRKREDLWAGSKGKDFGYFPVDAVQTEEVFVIEEVEVPTKETDFLCLDGGKYVFENKNSIFNTVDEEKEYIPSYTNEDYTKSNKSGDEALEVAGTSFPKEYKEPDSDNSKSKDQLTPEVTRHGDSELRGSKTGVDESIQQEDKKSQNLKPDPKQATWSVSGIADWFGLGGEEEEPVREISKTAEQITFRRRKIAVIDDSDLKKTNDDSETETSTWFQSTLADLMDFGSEKAGFGLQYRENYPDVQDISSITGDADHHGSTTASNTQEEEPRDSTVSQSNWFDLDIRDVFTFGYSNENEVKTQKYEQTEATSPNEESLPPSIKSSKRILIRGETKTSESPHHEVQEKHVQEITKVKKTDSKVQLANDCTDFKEATDTSISTEPGDKLLKSHFAEHSSVSDSEIMENRNAKAIMKESGRKNDESGWYGSIYSSVFGFSSIKLDNQPSHNSVSIQKSQELVIKRFLPSHSTDQGFLPKDSLIAREENSGNPQTYQSFFSFRSFTNTLNAKCFVSKEKENVQITVQALKSREESKKEDNIKKESKVQLMGNQKVTEKDSVVLSVTTPIENILLSSLATKNHAESREKTQGNELVKDNTSPCQSVKFRLEQGICNGHHIQMAYGKTENLEIQDNFIIKDKNDSPVLEDKQCSSLELENIDDLLTQEKYTGEVYSHEKFVPAIEEPDGIPIRSKDKPRKVDHSHLSATEIYLVRLRNGEMTETTEDKDGSHQATDRKLKFKELKYTDNFLQMKGNPHEGEELHKVSKDNKLEIQQSREQMLSANFEVIQNTEIRARNSDSTKNLKKCNDFSPNDILGINKNLFPNQNEEGAVVSQGTQKFKFPSSSRDLTDASIFEEKTSKFDEFQNFLSFNDHEHLLSFLQSSTEEDKDSLQRSQDNISAIDENSQLKSCPQPRNKEMEKEQFCHNNLKMKKEGISNKDILLSSLAKQNKDSEGINLLKDKPSVSSAKHPSRHIMESLFSNQKLNGKSTEDSKIEQFPNNQLHLLDKQHEAPILTFSVQKLSQDYKVINEKSTFGLQDVNEKEEIKKNFVSEVLERDYIDVMKREQVSDSLSSLESQSEKHVNDNIQGGYVVDSYGENESPDLKSEVKLCLDHTKDYFPTNSDDNNNLIKSVVPTETIHQLSQNRIKKGQLSQCVSELSESKQGDRMQDTENKLKKQTNKNHSKISNNQEPSPVATSKGVFKNEKDIPGNGTCLSKDDFINNRVQSTDIQVPHKWKAGKHGEEEHSSKPIQENFDHSKVSDASLTAKAVDNHGLKEKFILSYPTSGTFSSKMPVSLPYLKENQKDLKVEQEVLSSHPELSDYTEKLSGGVPTVNSDRKQSNDQHLKTNKIPAVNNECKMCTTESSGLLNLKERMKNPMTQNSTFRRKREWLFQNDICDLKKSAFLFMMLMGEKVVAALPENVKPGPKLCGFPWEMVIYCAIVALLIVFLLIYRSYQSVRSRLYAGRENQLASKVAELVEEKCKLLEKLSLCNKEYEELENSLKDASLLSGSTSVSNLQTECEQLSSSNSVLMTEIEHIEKEWEEEKSKHSQQDALMTEMQQKKESLENEEKSICQQIAEAKTTLKVYEINREKLKVYLQDAVEENSHLQESEKQLLQEAEGWEERFSELNEQMKMFESSKADIEESLQNKESQIKSLTECLLKMKDWSSAIGEHDDSEDNYWDNDMKDETENGEHLDDQDKRTIRKLIYAAKLNASLKSLETERNQINTKLNDEIKAKKELAERIDNLQREHVTLLSEKKDFESEVQKLQQKRKVITELYKENEMNLHRKLTVEEKERLQKEEKLSKVDEKINHAAEELATYRQRAKDLEDELERTVRSYQNQIMSLEKKAHDNWLTAHASERLLSDIKRENLDHRQELTEAEIKCELLEKDPYAFHVPVRTFGREHSPYGPSPMGRLSSETRAFLSPPTLLEGPLRLSPVLPGGGGRGSRGPGNVGIYEAGNEKEELSSDRLSNPHRPPSDSGSLSPPWDRDRRIMFLPAGQSYNDQSLPPQRQERFYPNPPNSGRFSEPAELRSYSMHSFDKADGHISENNSRMDLSGNGIKDVPDSNMPKVADHPVAPEGETFGLGIMPPPPPPLMRAPLMPMDPRGPFIRRGPPFPTVPPSGVYGPREYFSRDFAGLPHPPLPIRTPFPLRPFSQYPPPRAGFFPPPPPPPPPDNSNELPAGLTQLSTAASTDHQEYQQET